MNTKDYTLIGIDVSGDFACPHVLNLISICLCTTPLDTPTHIQKFYAPVPLTNNVLRIGECQDCNKGNVAYSD